ncbi:hypothetical protein FISHEDRAFT_54086 [Fistulina hepatica ATCC 64428]|uniref:NADAR domain-containing protein n=1 Tax=Fistulina hepatica ATCC 64428 TaxID=1128425 RepID=A0A0D6ZZ92_9AGAR|nr:hypothetical protein FISHEDRAFT_54086 [Fistulina hepatica ATCC 64428]
MGVTTHILPRNFAGENGDGSVSDAEDLYDPGERPIVFTQLEPYPGFMNHSPHAIMYGDRSYPTGTHLFEAMKFLPNSPAIAEQIRQCPNVDDVPGISAQFATQQSPDFSQNFMQKYDEVLDLKFNQHPQLRAQLCETARALLLYHDPGDAFWGNGEDGVSGRNECGQALMRARKIFLDRNS